MIQYYENIPFCIMQPEEAGVRINCHEIVKFLEYVEPQICSIPNDKNTVYKYINPRNLPSYLPPVNLILLS